MKHILFDYIPNSSEHQEFDYPQISSRQPSEAVSFQGLNPLSQVKIQRVTSPYPSAN